MRITAKNFKDMGQSVFYKASQSGVQICHLVRSFTKSSNYSDSIANWGPTIEPIDGYVADSMFYRIRYEGVNYVPVYTDIAHFDNLGTGFFTTEAEAIELHRQLVINYIKGLNASSLKTCPIDVD